MAGDNEALIAVLKNHEYPHADVKDRCAVYVTVGQEDDNVYDLDGHPVFAEDIYEAALAGLLRVCTVADNFVEIVNPHIAVDEEGRIGAMINPSDPPMWIEKRDSDEHVFD